MMLVAISRTLNESDIVEAFVRHTAYYVDHHIFLDNGSTDGTLEILRKLKKNGFGITIYQTKSRSFVESHAITFMYRRAVVDHKAAWVVCLDADEFIDDRELGRPFRDYLAEFGTERGDLACIKVRLRDYHCTPDDAPHSVVPNRLTQCAPVSNNTKVIVKHDQPQRRVTIQAGSHSARIGDAEAEFFLEPALSYAHYPVRSPYQWISKFIIGWSKVLAAGPETVRIGQNYHYRQPFDLLRTDPAKLLRNRALMNMLTAPRGLTHDPIVYRGGELEFTEPTDYPMRTVQVLMQYLHDLAVQHGEMMEPSLKISGIVRRDERDFNRVE